VKDRYHAKVPSDSGFERTGRLGAIQFDGELRPAQGHPRSHSLVRTAEGLASSKRHRSTQGPAVSPVRDLVDRHYARAIKMRLVKHDLNTHDLETRDLAFPAERGASEPGQDWVPLHPERGSRLSMGEAQINIMHRQCLERRADDRSVMADDGATWEEARNARLARVHPPFTAAVARQELA
jgi:hypothetical protein